jgi:hypothetical protein
MPYPFPGMNPWLEQASEWPDFHSAFLNELRTRLVPQVRPRYAVKVELRLHVHDQSASVGRFFGQTDTGLVIAGAGGAVGVRPAVSDVPSAVLELPTYEVVREHYLTITDVQRRRVVTIVELLSPSNKSAGRDRQAYVAKRRQILHSATHLVEIDLLRGGARMTEPELPASAYAVVVSRATGFRRAEVWSVGLRERLPRIPVPLAGSDADVAVDLQLVVASVYESAGYADYLYAFPPDVPLEPADAEWAQALLAQAQNVGG